MRKFIVLFLAICIGFVIVHQFLLQSPANGDWEYNLGMLFQALSLSYIAAFLFFLVHNYHPYLLTKKKYQPVIDRELSDLWEICKYLSDSMESHSKPDVKIPFNTRDITNKMVVEMLRRLPVNLNSDVREESMKNLSTMGEKQYPVIPDDKFDEKNKPIVIRGLGFDKWSEATEYVNSTINSTLNKMLQMKDVVEKETILKLFDLEKSSNDFRMVAKIYEEAGNQTFKNGYLEERFINFYKGTGELRKYNKNYK